MTMKDKEVFSYLSIQNRLNYKLYYYDSKGYVYILTFYVTEMAWAFVIRS